MNLTTIVEPPVEPVTVAEVYEYLRWDADYEGSPPEPVYPLRTTIERNIRTARIWVEQATRRALVKQTVRLDIPSPPHPYLMGWGWQGGWSANNGIELLRPPVADIVSVTYFDGFNASQVIDPAGYYLSDDYVPQLRFVDGWDMPCMYRRPDAFRVTYQAGYAWSESPADYTSAIPASLKDAVCLGVQLLADRFDPNEKADLTRTRDDIVSSFRVHTF